MKEAVTHSEKVASTFGSLEELEERRLLAAAVPWGDYPVQVGLDKVVADYPWLTGKGFGVAVVDKGIDYLHPLLGGNPATNTPSPRITNVFDWLDNDTNPFPDVPESQDPSTAHATGVAGILVGLPTDQKPPTNGSLRHYQGLLQGAQLYNLRTNRFNSQNTIKDALQWVVENHEKYHITAINLTDFVGTGSLTAVYDAQLQKLWDAGIFIATPVANDWLGDPKRSIPARQAIGFPARHPFVFGTGGNMKDGSLNPQTQRGAGLDLLGPSWMVDLPYYKPDDDTHVWTNGGKGNSWGTPHVVGTAVLLQQVDPTLRPAEIMQILQDSGTFVPDTVDGTRTGYAGYKRLDMYAAVQRTYALRDDASDNGAGNDTLATATAIPLDASGSGTLAGRKLLIGDSDYYSFRVAKGGGKYDLSAVAGAKLLDAGGNAIATIGSGGLKGQQLGAGTYYVQMRDTGKSVIGYTVEVKKQVVDEPPVPTPGVVGENGTFNDMKYDADGNLHFVWYDASNKTLKYAERNAAKVWGAVTTIDGAPDVGSFVSMAIDGQGRPGVAYYDAANADLKYAKFNGSAWSVEVVESTNTVGYYPSLKFDAADRPVVAYYYKTGGALRFAAMNAGGTWDVTTVDSKGDVGRYPSLALNPANGRWGIAYETTSGGAFKYSQKTKSGWATSVVDANGAGGGFISLTFDAANRPAFSYYDAKKADLKLARFDGSVWSTRAVAAKNSQGLYSNLFFDGADPVVYYFNKTGNTLNAARGSGGGSTFAMETLETGGGRENRVAIDSQGFETYSWFDAATRNLKTKDL